MALLDAFGLAVDNAEGRNREPEFLGADLRQDRFHALPHRSAAGDDIDDTILADFENGAILAVDAALLDEGRNPDADHFPVGLAAFDLAAQIGIGDMIEHVA